MSQRENVLQQALIMNEQIYGEILNRYKSIFKSPEELEVFLLDPDRYTTAKGIDDFIGEASSNIQMACLTNIKDIRFSHQAQKGLYNTIVSERVGALMTRPESLKWKTEINNIIKNNSKKSWKDISKEIQKQTDIGKSNADRIARTEEHIARTNAEYITAKERGATHFYCVCNNPCPKCAKQYGGGGKDKMFEIDETSKLPPVHPNCRCNAIFVKDKDKKDIGTSNNVDSIDTSNNVDTSQFDFEIEDTKSYIKELKNDLKGLTNKYDIMDLEEEIKMYESDLASLIAEKEAYIKSQQSNVKKIKQTEVKFTNDTNIEKRPSELKNVYGDSTNHIPKSVRTNLNEFTKANNNLNYERMQYYTDSGKISDLLEGHQHHVGNTTKVANWLKTMKDHNENVHMVHNHPGYDRFTFLSGDDLRIWREQGYKSMSASCKNCRCTVGLLETTDVNSRAFGKAYSDMISYLADISEGKHNFKLYESSKGLQLSDEAHQEIAENLSRMAKEGGFYYKLEDLDLSETKNSVPKSNMKDERTEYEKINDKIYDLSSKISNETNPDKKAKLQAEYKKLVNMI